MITLGIDCGTQSTKTIALDSVTGQVLASSSQSYGVIDGLPSGHMEQDPGVWIDALENTVTSVLDKLGSRRSEVRAIGVSGQQHGFVPVDAEGKVIRPAKLWCDTSTVAQCEQIRAAFGGVDRLIAEIGNDVLPGFTAPKILWLKQNEPENFKRLKTVLLPHDFLNFYLTGVYRMEYGDASGTALLNVKTRAWSKSICDVIDPGLLGMLPPLGSSKIAHGSLKSDLTSKWKLTQSVVISSGGGDNMMGAIGTGNITAGCVTASLGTSGTIFACAGSPVIDPQGEIAAFCDSNDQWLPLLCTMNVTVATEAFRNQQGWTHAQFEEAVSQVPAGADGLIFLPYLQGERTPNLPQGSGTFHGVTTKNMTTGHFARAVIEGVTLGMAYGLKRLRQLGVPVSEIRLTGGGSNSRLWRQLCADVFEAPVVCLKSAEGAALGAAIQALATVDTTKDLAAWVSFAAPVDSTSRVEPARAFDYQQKLEAMNALRQSIYRK